MSLSEMVVRFENRKIAVEKGSAQDAIESAIDILALAKNRVINQRLDDQGEIFGIYADSTWSQKRAKRNGDRRINFSETNRMWATVHPFITEFNEQGVVFQIRSLDPDRNEVWDHHHERFDRPLILLSETEARILAEIYGAKIDKRLQ